MTQLSITAVLAEFAANLQAQSLPETVVRGLGRGFFDQIAVIMAAGTLGGASRQVVDWVLAEGGSGATVLGYGRQATPSGAAFANGALAHALDYEETHDATMVHPAASVVPAALAIAEATGASGERLLTALAAGSELCCRIGRSFVGNPQARTRFYVLPHVGVFGATAAAGVLLGLSPAQMVDAFAMAMNQVVAGDSALNDPRSAHREIRDAYNARGGVVAAGLAARGVTANSAAFEGPSGYYALFQNGAVDISAFDTLGAEWECAALSLKPWPSCRGTHSFVEAALELQREHAFAAADIAGFEVEISQFFATLCEPLDLRAAPPTAAIAKFSVPFTLAAAWVTGGVTLDTYAPEALADPTITALARLCSHTALELPQSRATHGKLTVSLQDGRRLSRKVADPLGHADRPMSDMALLTKARDCMARARRPVAFETIDRLAAQCRDLRAVGPVGIDLIAPLTA